MFAAERDPVAGAERPDAVAEPARRGERDGAESVGVLSPIGTRSGRVARDVDVDVAPRFVSGALATVPATR